VDLGDGCYPTVTKEEVVGVFEAVWHSYCKWMQGFGTDLIAFQNKEENVSKLWNVVCRNFGWE
jgi:hypothetical protein